jgi:hypothetical protein
MKWHGRGHIECTLNAPMIGLIRGGLLPLRGLFGLEHSSQLFSVGAEGLNIPKVYGRQQPWIGHGIFAQPPGHYIVITIGYLASTPVYLR